MIYGNPLHCLPQGGCNEKRKNAIVVCRRQENAEEKRQNGAGRSTSGSSTDWFHPGVVEAVLAATGEIIEEELSDGRSVTLRGIGSFQTAVTSKGFEHPEDVLPHSVRLSRVYFKADRMLTLAVKRAGCHRIPFKYYFPKELLTKKMELADKQEEREEDEMDGAECS